MKVFLTAGKELYLIKPIMNSTESTGTGLNSPAAGYVALVVAALGFGTNYLPIKKFNMGDGMFFQWIMCTAIVFVGLIVHCAVGSPKFYPLAMLGGAFWGTGNALIVTIVDAIGVGLGMLVWSMANMLYGFASSRFGWFGIPSKIPSNPVMNYVGVGIAAGSGIFLSLCTGTLFGNIFVPTLYIQGNYENASQQGLDYVFPVCAGVWVASTVIFIIYACAKRNQPWIPAPSAILPALGSGILWAIAETAWSISNTSLGEPITFPIVTTVPALITTLCGVVFFKEIRVSPLSSFCINVFDLSR
nr:unnamed protein product [Spirometra erinaceieuropaei]